MGSYLSSCRHAGKIVLPDGGLQELDQPMAVAELMLEHPQNIVVEFRPESTAKLLPLPADHKLHPSGVYLLVPMARGKASGVSVEEARRMLASQPRMTIPLMIPFVGTCIRGASQRKVKLGYQKEEQKTVGTKQDEKMELEMEGFNERAEILCRQYSSKGWKPSLGTIAERNFEKLPHWLF